MSEIIRIDPSFLELDGIMPNVFKDIEQYRDNHRFLLVVSASFVELLVSLLIEEHCKNKTVMKDTRSFPFSVRLTLLNEMNIISDFRYISLNWLRKQRNRAAHEADFQFTKGHYPKWMDSPSTDTVDLFSICVGILGTFWNEHVELFREKLPFEKS